MCFSIQQPESTSIHRCFIRAAKVVEDTIKTYVGGFDRDQSHVLELGFRERRACDSLRQPADIRCVFEAVIIDRTAGEAEENFYQNGFWGKAIQRNSQFHMDIRFVGRIGYFVYHYPA